MSNEIQELLDMIRVRDTTCVSECLSESWNVCLGETPQLARFHLVLSGQTLISVTGSERETQLNSGDIVIIPNGKAHCYFDGDLETTTSENTKMLCGYFEFSNSTPSSITSNLPDILIERSGGGSYAYQLELIVQLIGAEIDRPSKPQQCVLNRLTEILCLHTIQNWFKQALSTDETLQALASPRIKEVIDNIHAKPSAPWTVDSLARVYGQSRAAFAAHFKFATGRSPISYVRHCRINKACKMLEATGLPVGEVAFQSGYADANAFNRAFRRETGASPSAYRRAPRT